MIVVATKLYNTCQPRADDCDAIMGSCRGVTRWKLRPNFVRYSRFNRDNMEKATCQSCQISVSLIRFGVCGVIRAA
jgi:hypothetical protein